MIHKLVAAALCCWYLLSVLGFDVHVCGHTGRVYVESLLAFVSSDDNCDVVNCDCSVDDCCCQHHDEDTDCEDTVEKIDLPGALSCAVQMPAPSVAPVHTIQTVEVPSILCEAPFSERGILSGPPMEDVLSAFCIMRV